MTAQYHDLAGTIPLLADAHESRSFPGPYRRFGKRMLDIVLVLMAAPALLLIVGLLAFLVALDGGKPFYSQPRVGRGGRTFTMWKLRSMVINADDLLEEHLSSDPKAREEWNKTQKLRNDPRITSIGRFLRKSSLDELPQLWNVLRGDMSLVGPRPMLLSQRALYPGLAYYHLRPGCTGPWQVSSRNDTSFSERAYFDDFYYKKVSLSADIRLIFATFHVVLRATGH